MKVFKMSKSETEPHLAQWFISNNDISGDPYCDAEIK